MKPIRETHRKVANIHDATAYRPYDTDAPGGPRTFSLQLNPDTPRDVGFYIYRMEPGAVSVPHRHGGAEEFVMIEGTLIDNDGTVYGPGDVVWLAGGSEHWSRTETGCVIAVYAQAPEEAPGSNAG